MPPPFSNTWANVALVAVAAVCVLIVVLVPMSFGDLEYYEMGFLRNKATGVVDTSKVYFGGRHYVGIIKEFKTFQTTKITTEYQSISVFNKEKMQIILSCSLQFVLRPEDLKLLHDAYDIRYEPIIIATAGAAIKGAATKYSIDEFRLNRSHVAEGLRTAVSIALDGGCCRKDCRTNKCQKDCIEYSRCKDKGVYSSIAGFQLRLVDLNREQTNRFLRQVLEQELKDTEIFRQEEKVTRKRTEELKAEVENLANEVAQNANAQRSLIEKTADIEAQKIVANATNRGLSIIHDKLGLSDEAHKKTLDYVRTLRNHKGSNLFVGFQYMVANAGGTK